MTLFNYSASLSTIFLNRLKEIYILDDNKKKYTYKQFKRIMDELAETAEKYLQLD